MLMLILILDPQVPNWMWMTLILPSQSCSKPKGRNEMVIDCQARLCRIIKYLHNQVFRRGCYQDENELNNFSIASLGTNINYTDDDFYVFYKRRSQVTVKYWVKWMNHNGQNKEAYTCHKIREVICCLKLHLLWLTYCIFRYIQFGDSLAVKVKKIILALKSSLRTSEPANWCYAIEPSQFMEHLNKCQTTK